MQPAIHVQNLGKRYRLGATHSQTLGSLVTSAAERMMTIARRRSPAVASPDRATRPVDSDGHFWALKDVSFDVQPGEVVGVIGKNGAGKSTLLKILSRITPPTTGSAELRGRVASLLEVGTGFHPELTGRENIFLNSAILGLTKAEVREKFDEIVAFAEIERFIDTPVKRYSSGMYVRLAFAVAAHLEPEILIVDEVLAVGDAAFQRKCLSKIKDVGRNGRTVLFVSHNMVAVQSLCDTAIRFEGGRFCRKGPATDVIADYLRGDKPVELSRSWDDADAPGDQLIRLRSAALAPADGHPEYPLTLDAPLDFTCDFELDDSKSELHFGLHLHDEQGQCVFATASPSFSAQAGSRRATCRIPPRLLNDGQFRLSLFIARDGSVPLLSLPDLISFELVDHSREHRWYGKWPGCVRPDLEWNITET